MSEQVIVIGASGHGKVVADIVRKSGDTLLGFLDDNKTLPPAICGIPVLGKTAEYAKYPEASFVIAIGNAAVREKIARQLDGVRWYTAIHPSAVISPLDVHIGVGSVVMANAVVNPSAHIGKHCILNTTAVVEHDNRIGDFAHISVGAKLGGTVTIGNRAWVGIGAAISNNVTICDDCMVGAGAVVICDIKESGTYVGVPARKNK
ncbi:MAG: acetyltransferase [Oscillospiraceae bacterium]|nr:acetyltransferase [Oscillospiraceae bacterium]